MKNYTHSLLLLLLLLVFSLQQAFAQCTYTTVKAGNFNDPTIYTVTGGGSCTQGSLPTASSVVNINHAVTLNQNFTVGNNGSLTIGAAGSLVENAAYSLTVSRGSLTIAAVANRSVSRLSVSTLSVSFSTATVGANSALQIGCLYLGNQGGLSLGNSALLNIAGNVDVSNGNGTITGPTTGLPAGIRVTGNFTGVNGGTSNVYNATGITSCVQQLSVASCTSSGQIQQPPTNNDPSCRNVLPVTLTHFLGKATPTGAELTWATATEIRNAFFEIQRSSDGKTFQTIGTVAGQGSTNQSSAYSYTDYSTKGNELRYYRLRQVDTDGTATLSSVVTVASTDELQASFYPNPSNSSITLPAVNGMVEYRVYSVTGKLLAAGKGVGNSSVAIQDIPVGVYFLELTAGGKRNVQRFVRQ